MVDESLAVMFQCLNLLVVRTKTNMNEILTTPLNLIDRRYASVIKFNAIGL